MRTCYTCFYASGESIFPPWCKKTLRHRKGVSTPKIHLLYASGSWEGQFSGDTRKNGKGPKTGASHDWRSFYLSQYDWLKGSHMSRVVWLPNETDYSCCEFVAPNTPYIIVLYYCFPKNTHAYTDNGVHWPHAC